MHRCLLCFVYRAFHAIFPLPFPSLFPSLPSLFTWRPLLSPAFTLARLGMNDLRAELCQARHKAQLVRAQKAVLKKEVRDMWSRNASLSSSLSSRALPPKQKRRSSAAPTAAAAAAGLALSQKRHDQGQSMRSRPWASMGNLAQANAASSASGPAAAAAAAVAAAVAAGTGSGGSAMGLKRRSMTSASFADVAEEAEEEGEAAAGAAAVEFVGGREAVGEAATSGGGGGGRGSGNSGSGSGGSAVFRPCLSRASLAASDEGGETDFADQTISEVSVFVGVFVCAPGVHRKRLNTAGKAVGSGSSIQRHEKPLARALLLPQTVAGDLCLCQRRVSELLWGTVAMRPCTPSG